MDEGREKICSLARTIILFKGEHLILLSSAVPEVQLIEIDSVLQGAEE